MPEDAKNELLFLDTETTGREVHDRIFQLAFVFMAQLKNYKGKNFSISGELSKIKWCLFSNCINFDFGISL